VALVPFLLQGVVGMKPNQRDGIHHGRRCAIVADNVGRS
jgi:hypothetical protein